MKTVTIGIPAHNEGTNIKKVLESISQQMQTNYQLEKVIIIADGCTDDTLMQAYSLQLKKLELISLSPRQGKANALNQIINRSKSDILILLDADIQITDHNFVDKLIKPLIIERADLTSAKVLPKKGESFLSKILYISNDFKQQVYESWNQGNNIYTCHGRAIAMNRKLYSQMDYTGILADDALAFITAQRLKLKYQFAKEATVYYRLPQTIDDHEKQSSRFLQSQKQFSTTLDSKFISELYSIPPKVLIQKMFSFIFKNPVSMSMYIFLFAYLKLKSFTKNDNLLIWEIAKTSKV